MGNMNTACQMMNHSKRNVRVILTEKALEIDHFIVSEAGVGEKITSLIPGSKKFHFKEDVKCIRVMPSQSKEVPWEAGQFVTIFVEDEDDEKVCSKQIMHNMELSAPVTVLLYDV